MPSCFSTVQVLSGRIYMIGGLVKDIIMKNTFQIDENLVYEEMALMKVGRFNTPVTLLKDKYILAAGGQTSTTKNKFTSSAELFDINSNKWITLESMQKPRSNTSLCQVQNRFVFIFHGLGSAV